MAMDFIQYKELMPHVPPVQVCSDSYRSN